MSIKLLSANSRDAAGWRRYLPAADWLRRYRRADFTADLLAGLIVAIMLVPQSMAYALLAGLPPQVGLYASILPLALYGLLGTSRALAVGPVAMVSLLVASGVGRLAEAGSPDYIQLALTLALLVGLLQAGLGVLRAGFLVNFLSHPVLSGFTSAAAILIAFSQVKHLLGVPLPSTENFIELVSTLSRSLGKINGVTATLALAAVLALLFFKNGLPPVLRRLGLPGRLIETLSKTGPLFTVAAGTLAVWGWGLHDGAGVSVVGQVPAGLPSLTAPSLDLSTWRLLFPTALAISLVGYMESISVARALAGKRREKVDPDQELIALGVANLGATVTGGYPVTGGISRSVVNYAAGAQTGMASIITAALIAVTVLLLTPLFYFLPQAILAAIILVAVAGMVDIAMLRKTWRYSRIDGLSLLLTFGAVLVVGVEAGILYGAAGAILLYIWRTSRPHFAVVGRLGNSELYRNVDRHEVQTWDNILALRVDESLTFANSRQLEETILGLCADHPAIEHLVLIATAVNFIDASALETLEALHDTLQEAGIALHLAALKGPVHDRLERSRLFAQIGADHIHESTHDAMKALGYVT